MFIIIATVSCVINCWKIRLSHWFMVWAKMAEKWLWFVIKVKVIAVTSVWREVSFKLCVYLVIVLFREFGFVFMVYFLLSLVMIHTSIAVNGELVNNWNMLVMHAIAIGLCCSLLFSSLTVLFSCLTVLFSSLTVLFSSLTVLFSSLTVPF